MLLFSCSLIRERVERAVCRAASSTTCAAHRRTKLAGFLLVWLTALLLPCFAEPARADQHDMPPKTYYRTALVNGHSIFYREAGDSENATIVLLHGFPSSSHTYRELIPLL